MVGRTSFVNSWIILDFHAAAAKTAHTPSFGQHVLEMRTGNGFQKCCRRVADLLPMLPVFQCALQFNAQGPNNNSRRPPTVGSHPRLFMFLPLRGKNSVKAFCPNAKTEESLLSWGNRLRESMHNSRFYLSASNAFRALRRLGQTPSKGENVAGLVAGLIAMCQLSC